MFRFLFCLIFINTLFSEDELRVAYAQTPEEAIIELSNFQNTSNDKISWEIRKSKIIAGLSNLYIANVPTPIFLPFAYFPLTENRRTGFIFPSIGQNNDICC